MVKTCRTCVKVQKTITGLNCDQKLYETASVIAQIFKIFHEKG